MNKQIIPITDPEDFIRLRDFIWKSPFVNMTPAFVLGKCLEGEYKGYKLLIDSEVIGLVIYQFVPAAKLLTWILVYCPGHVKDFQPEMLELIKQMGVKKAVGVSLHREDIIMTNIMRGLNPKIYTIYEVTL